MNWQGIRCLTKFVFGSEITGSGSSSGESVSPDLEVVDPAIKTRELPVGIKARQSAVGYVHTARESESNLPFLILCNPYSIMV